MFKILSLESEKMHTASNLLNSLHYLILTLDWLTYTQQKSSAQLGIRVNSVLTRNGCIKCYISLFKEIILQQFVAFQTEIQGSLTKRCAFNASRGYHSIVAKLPIMSPGAENMEYLNNP